MNETMVGQAGHSSEPTPPPAAPPPAAQAPSKPILNTERWKAMIIILTMINTILVAIVAGLQTDANIRANDANRDSQYYAVLTSGELHRIGLQTNYDMNTFARILDNGQRSLVMGLTSLEQLQNGDEAGAALSSLQEKVAQAQSDAATKFSIFYQDSRYAPKSSDAQPDLQKYLDDSNVKALELLASQNAAADAYKIWSGKSDSYVAVLTILAIAFFLFGIAQSVNPRLRLLFAGFGILVIMLGVGWALVILIG
jgi:hypothetical protein